jgi:hypothetical protein
MQLNDPCIIRSLNILAQYFISIEKSRTVKVKKKYITIFSTYSLQKMIFDATT